MSQSETRAAAVGDGMRRGGDNSQSMRALVQLRDMLLNGKFAPGERLSELRLVDMLGASRSPVRLALTRLEHEGLLEMRPGGGYVVRAFTSTELKDATELRGVLEGSAARLAAERGSDSQCLARMQACSDAMEIVVREGGEELDSLTQYMELNDEFHSLLMDLAGSAVLKRAISHALTLPFAAPSAFVLEDRQHEMFVVAQSQHREMLEAIRNREGARAEGIGREHARLAGRSLRLKLRHELHEQQADRMPALERVRRV
jgi:GntR family transcriptional regulator of vanillate catabolism